MAGKGKSIDTKSKNKTKNKKSTKGQKNWRKNIDISDLEKKNLQKDQEKLVERDVKFMKDEELFVIDTEPMKNIKESLLKKKTKRTDKVKKYSLNEEIKVKRMCERIKKDEKEQKEQKPIEKEIKSLWDDEDKPNTKLIKKKTSKITPSTINNSLIKFPTLPIPHPGQSYNPSKQDISSLLHKIVDLNKRPEPQEVEKITKEGEERFFPESDDDEVIDQSCSNNPAVDDYTQRKSKTDKKKSIIKKLNRLKEKDLIQKKENKIELANEKSLNRIQKEQEANLKEVTEKKSEELRKRKEKEELLKMGFVEEYFLKFIHF